MTRSPARLGSSNGNWASSTTLIGTMMFAIATPLGCRNQGSAKTRLTAVPITNTATSKSWPRLRRVTGTSEVGDRQVRRRATWPVGTMPPWFARTAIRSVVPGCVLMGQRGTRRPIAGADVPEAPADLGDRIGPPVGAERRHLVPGQRLRDAVGAGAAVGGRRAPAALPSPQRLEAAPLALAVPLAQQHRVGDPARIGRQRRPGRRTGRPRHMRARLGLGLVDVGQLTGLGERSVTP